jgi:hypothetical protein
MSGVVLGNDNITIGGKILETTKSVGNIGLESDFPTFDNDTFVEPVIHFFPDVLPYVAPINIPGTGFAYVALVNTGATQTSYTMNFQENTECDILVVGGGGGASGGHGGGGGAGQLILVANAILNGTYNISVDKGGIGGKSTEQPNGYQAIKGFNSSFGSLIAEAGGTNTSTSTDKNGGSGAGGDGWTPDGGTSGYGVKNSSTDIFASGTVYSRGNDGSSNQSNARGGGGGGAGVAGNSSTGAGGDGLSGISEIGYDFRTNFGTSVGQYIAGENKVYFAGGGGGGANGNVSGGKGGGGAGTGDGPGSFGGSGVANTGGGGGGGGSNSIGGNGGSGIVIIRFRTTRVIPIIMLASDPIPASIISTIDSNYKYAFFANTGGNPTVYNIDFKQPTECDVLIIGGGGGGGMDMGGGGGAGGFIKLNNQYFNGLYTINVGKGGDGAPAAGTNGQPGDHQFTINAKNGGNSQFGNNIAIGGGYGGSSVFTHQLAGQGSSGGSGGGSSGYNATNTISKAGVGTVGQGNRGGFGLNNYHSGGGGGAGSIGGGSPSNAAGAAFGGFGIYSDITGEGYYWAGGGGGAGYTTTGGNGGLGGGGGGAVNTTFGGIGYNNGEPGGGGSINAQTNRPGGNGGQHTGGGGGGGSHFNSNNKGGDGGSGVVIIRYRYNKKLLSIRIDTDYNYFALYNAGENQTQYNITFPENTECEILVVAGGGAGGTYIGGGGGGGGVLHIQNAIISSGTYNIKVGNGGANISGTTAGTVAVNNGKDTELFGIIVKGGGFGGTGEWSGYGSKGQDGGNGGSGGAGGSGFTAFGNAGTLTTANIGTVVSGVNIINSIYYGGNGANGIKYVTNGAGSVGGNGGGGAGGNAIPETGMTKGGNGADGTQINIDGNNYYWGGGGGGGMYAGGSGSLAGNGGMGGGGGGNGSQATEGVGNGGTGGITNGQNGDLEGDGTPTAGNGGAGTGGGGGGTGRTTTGPNAISGAGGSGIVIIRYKVIKTNFDAQWTYNSTNPSVYHIGNVGIGTTNPRSALSIVGSVSITGEYLARTKTFKIEHPLNMNKWLYHGCVEAPRFDNMYRGKKRIKNGKCEVDIDKECNDTGGMTDGTFDALNADSQLYLQNTNTFDAVKGSIKDGKIIIICENTIDDIDVDWLVIGERQDENIIGNRLTNNMGNLICEHNVD